MNAIEILDLSEKIKKYEGLTINEVNLKELIQGPAKRFYSKDLEDYKFSIGATGEIRAELYNSPDDQDDHGIIGEVIPPLNNNHGFIKYIADGNTKFSGAIKGKRSAFSLIQQNQAVYSVYKSHSLSEDISEAIKKDLASFISVLDITGTGRPLGSRGGRCFTRTGQVRSEGESIVL